jgi:hypothetical protein
MWTQVGAQAVVKMKASAGSWKGACSSSRAATPRAVEDLSRHRPARRGPRVRQRRRAVVHQQARRVRIAHRVRDDRPGAHEIAAVDMDGGRMSVLTKMGSDSLLPAYSPGGGRSRSRRTCKANPDLWIVSSGGGRARRVSKQPGLNTGAAWSPTVA